MFWRVDMNLDKVSLVDSFSGFLPFMMIRKHLD